MSRSRKPQKARTKRRKQGDNDLDWVAEDHPDSESDSLGENLLSLSDLSDPAAGLDHEDGDYEDAQKAHIRSPTSSRLRSTPTQATFSTRARMRAQTLFSSGRGLEEAKKVKMRTRSQGHTVGNDSLPSQTAPLASLNPDCLTNVFSFLPAVDLCRVAQVCRHWHGVAQFPSLWRMVSVSMNEVRSWDQFLRFFLGRQSLRRLSLQGDMEGPWKWDLRSLGISQLRQLTHLYLHDVPAEVVHLIPERLPRLKTLWCEKVALTHSQTVDFAKFRGMSQLTELCIHSWDPLRLPAFSFQGSISQLRALTGLITLVVSNVEGQIFSEFTFLRHLRRLTSLTIGYCFDWGADTYAAVGELQALEFLSLTGLPVKMEDAGLGVAFVTCLTGLPNLSELELIDFFIPDGLVQQPGHLAKLRRLRLVDQNPSQNGHDKLTGIQLLYFERLLELLGKLEGIQWLGWQGVGPLVYTDDPAIWRDRVTSSLPPGAHCELTRNAEE